MHCFSHKVYAVAAALSAVPAVGHAAFVISAAPTQNVTCSASGCAPTAADAVLNVAFLTAALAAGNFSLTTAGSGVDSQDIAFESPVEWYGPATLSLTASNSVIVNKKMSVNGYGGLAVVTHTNGGVGRLMLGKRGRIRFSHKNSGLNIDGNKYALEASLAELNGAYLNKQKLYVALLDNYDASGDGTYASYAVTVVGQMEGLGNTISNVTIVGANDSSGSQVGLVGFVDSGISDVRLLNVNVGSELKGAYVGGLTGIGNNMIGDDVTGVVSSKYGTAGGLAGAGAGGGRIIGSSAHVQVTGQQAGGLIGYAQGDLMVSQSSASGDVVATKYEGGGLIGFADRALRSETAVSQSFATGNVTGQGTKPGVKRSLGGLIGKAFQIIVEDCYAFGSVSGTQGDMGGLIGSSEFLEGTTSYAIGSAGPSLHAGGFLGHGGGVNGEDFNSNDYWDKATSGNNRGGGNGPLSNQGITGLNTRQLKAALPPGFSPAVWAENRMINNGYPYLIANPPH